MNNLLLEYILIFIVLEIFEVEWQKAGTLIGMLARMFHHYNKSIFIFLLMHPTFYFIAFVMVLSDYNIYVVSAFLMKSIDIGLKIIFMKKVFIDKEIPNDLQLMLLTPINRFLPYIGLVIYPSLIFMAI